MDIISWHYYPVKNRMCLYLIFIEIYPKFVYTVGSILRCLSSHTAYLRQPFNRLNSHGRTCLMKRLTALLLLLSLFSGCTGKKADDQPEIIKTNAIYYASACDEKIDPVNCYVRSGEDGLIYDLTDGVKVIGIDGEEHVIDTPKGMPLGVAFDKNGAARILIYENAGLSVYTLDPERKELTEKLLLATTDGKDKIVSACIFDGGGEYDLYITDDIYLYGLKGLDTYIILEWLELGITPRNIQALEVREGGSFILNAGELSYLLTTEPPEERTEKTTLKLATFKPGQFLAAMVAEFNRSNTEYTIEIVNYGWDGNLPEQDGYLNDTKLTKFIVDIISGKAPDIIDTSTIPMLRFAAKGLFEDLYPYLDEDPELKREDIYPGILRSLEYNGHLYETVDTFGICTLIGAQNIVGTQPGWTWEEMAAINSLETGIFARTPEYGLSPEELLQVFCTVYFNDFIDWTSGECDFTDPKFIEMLEMCAAQPSGNGPNDKAELFFRVVRLPLFAVQEYEMYENSIGEFTMKGFPDIGCLIEPQDNIQLSICAASEHKDAAWRFVRTPFTYEWQTNLHDGQERGENDPPAISFLHSRPDVMKQVLGWREHLTELNPELDWEKEKPIWEAILALIDRCNGSYRIDPALYNIIIQEAKAFFAGDKTVEQTAELIQSKALILVNEQR